MSGNDLGKILIELQGKIETIEAIKREKGENFNVFSILGMERLEVSTHSTFIYELLNPKGSHNQGYLYLQLFMEEVLGLKDYKKIVSVIREDVTFDGKRIDFTIETEEYQIGIEMKIDARDQKGQLANYLEELKKRCKKNQKARLYYLTLDGHIASDESTYKKLKESEDYYTVSFEHNIYNWIQVCIEKSASLPLIRENLVQYAVLIKKITGQTSKEITMEVIKMINNPKIAKAATEMAQNLGLAWAEREAIFWYNLIDSISETIKKNGWEIYEINKIFWKEDGKWNEIGKITEAIYNRRKNSNQDVEIIFTKAFKDIEIDLRLYQYNLQNRLHFQLDKINNFSIDNLAKELGLKRKYQGSRYDVSKIKISFYGKDTPDPTYDLFDDKKLDKFAKVAADEVLEKLSIIDEYFTEE